MGCSINFVEDLLGNEIVGLKILMEVKKASSRIKYRPCFGLIQGTSRWDAMKGNLLRKAAKFLRTASSKQKNSMSLKMNRHNRRLTCWTGTLILSCCTKRAWSRWKQGQATREACRNIAQIWRGGFRKVKAHLELRDKKQGTSRTTQKNFCCFSSTGIHNENVDLCWVVRVN